MTDFERRSNYLAASYETIESVHRDSRRELDIKLDKHQVTRVLSRTEFRLHFFQQLLQAIAELNKQMDGARRKLHESDLHSSLRESINNRLKHLEEKLSNLQEKAQKTFKVISTLKSECDQLIGDVKQMNDWLKLTDQQLNKYLVVNLSTAEEKKEAAKRILVSLVRFH